MRPNRYVILISFLFGALGIWFSADGIAQYLDTARSFTSVEAMYVQDSFEWLDAEHERGRAEITIINDAPNDVDLAHFSLNLYFDGVFAGARYEPWERATIPAGEQLTFDIPFFVSIGHMREQGSEAEISLQGQMRLEFDGIERAMTVRVSGPIGVVPYQEDQS